MRQEVYNHRSVAGEAKKEKSTLRLNERRKNPDSRPKQANKPGGRVQTSANKGTFGLDFIFPTATF